MHHVRVALYHHFFADFHRAGLADAADVVAAEVYQHHVFGDFFFVRQQFFFQRQVFFCRFAAFARAGQRAHGNGIALFARQYFRRGADDVEVVQIQQVHVRRRVGDAQRAVVIKRRVREGAAHALRRHHLHAVARHDVFADFADVCLEGRFGVVVVHFRTRAVRVERAHFGFAGAIDGVHHRIQPRFGGGNAVRVGKVGVADEVDFAAQVVQHGEVKALHE